MSIVRRVKDAAALREIERLKAENERNQGMIDYVAMMADVDLPDDENEEADDE